MCNYIKDDGEQCGMDDEPFCRHHDDTPQAQVYEQALTAAESASEFGDMETHCGECEAALRRRERLREHPHSPRRVVFEAYIECDCAEYTLGVKGVRKTELPDGWGA